MKRIAVCILTLLPLLMVWVVSAEFSQHSDEFDNAATLANWTPLASNATTATTIDIDTSEAGKMLIVPTTFHHNGWYASSIGPYVYKLIEGDFIVTSHIIAGNVNNHSTPPTGEYNSAGFVVRDPASNDPESPQNWLMYNHGAQIYNNAAGHSLATEAKNTINSTSVLTLRSTATNSSNSGQLTVCRSGETVYLFKWMDDEAGWLLEETIVRPDFPTTLQVGLVANAWTGSNLRAQFDYMRVYTGTVANSADCLTQLTTPTTVNVVANSAEITPPSLMIQIILLFAFVTALSCLIFSIKGSQTNVNNESHLIGSRIFHWLRVFDD